MAQSLEQNLRETIGNLVLQAVQTQTALTQANEQLAEVTADRDKLQALLDGPKAVPPTQ